MSETETNLKNPKGFQSGNTYGKGRPPGGHSAQSPKAEFLRDMDEIFKIALSHHKWDVALRARALSGRALGVFRMSKTPLPEVKRIKDMDRQQLQDFIERLEEIEPELKDLSEARELRVRQNQESTSEKPE